MNALDELLETVPLTRPSSPRNDLPNILVLAVGGTIAGKASTPSKPHIYEPGVVEIDELLEDLPPLDEIAQVDARQYPPIHSYDITSEYLVELSRIVSKELSLGSKYDGIVITQGTDSLEEVAFFIDHTVDSSKPVVFTGAIRPSNSISPDGYSNLYQAIVLAATADAANRGTMIAFNDRICSATFVQKMFANYTEAFKTPEQGYLGTMVGYRAHFYYEASRPTLRDVFDVSKVSVLPKVDILFAHLDFDPNYIKAAVEFGAKGIVIAALGSGGLTSTATDQIEAAVKAGVIVIFASRSSSGIGVPHKKAREVGAIPSGRFGPVQARLKLQIALASSCDTMTICSMFMSRKL